MFLRMAMQAIAQSLETGYGDGLVAGDYAQAILMENLTANEIGFDVFKPWTKYHQSISDLPRPPKMTSIQDKELDELSCKYADTKRATRDDHGRPETDAKHAMHLNLLGLPYAAEHHPDLDLSRLAIYFTIHDLSEAYAGDVPTLNATDDQLRQKAEDEARAIDRIKREFTNNYPKLIKMLDNYEDFTDDEARFARTFDKLDPGLSVIHEKGASLTDSYNLSREQFDKLTAEQAIKLMCGYGQDYSDLVGLQLEFSRRISDLTWPK